MILGWSDLALIAQETTRVDPGGVALDAMQVLVVIGGAVAASLGLASRTFFGTWLPKKQEHQQAERTAERKHESDLVSKLVGNQQRLQEQLFDVVTSRLTTTETLLQQVAADVGRLNASSEMHQSTVRAVQVEQVKIRQLLEAANKANGGQGRVEPATRPGPILKSRSSPKPKPGEGSSIAEDEETTE